MYMNELMTNKMKKVKNKKGFTLIELIVVIAILGILAAIAIPRLTGFTSDAKTEADRASLRTVESAISVAMAAGDLDVNDAGNGLEDGSGNALADDAAIIGILVPDYIDATPVSQVDNTKTLGFTIVDGNVTAVFN